MRWLNLGRAGSTASEAPASTVGKGGANSQTVGLVVAAAINSLGNITSRILGLVREGLIASIFGASGSTSAFDATSIVPKMVYELLIGGMLSAALVPVLSDYASEEHRAQMGHVLSILLSLAAVVLIAVVAALELGAHWVAPLLLGGFDSQLLSIATKLVRIIVPSILIYGFSGILQAYHYACKRFVYPAAGAPAHNLGMIIAVVLLAPRLDIASLSVGVLVAASAQLLVQLPGLRGLHLSLNFDWHHPAVRLIGQSVRKSGQVQSQEGLAAHGIDVAHGVSGGNRPVVIGVIHHRRKEIGGENQGPLVAQFPDGGIIRLRETYQQIGVVYL